MAFRPYRFVAMSAIGFAFLVQTAFAQVNPPDWWNQADGMTSSFGWTFDTDAIPPVPNISLAPFGDPEWSKDGQTSWFDTWNGHDGIWGVSPGEEGSLSLLLKNVYVPTNVKHGWMQVDFYFDFGSDITLLTATQDGSVFSNLREVDEDLANGWRRATITFDIFPQPNWERFDLLFSSPAGTNVGAYIDNLYVGTHCSNVPSPAALLSFALGAIAAFRRRRR